MTLPSLTVVRQGAEYQVVIPSTRVVLDAVPALERAKSVAEFHFRRLQHPEFPPQVVVERVSADGRRRRVWSPDPGLSLQARKAIAQ